MRVLMLGSGSEIRELRQQAERYGLEVAERLTASVTHVVIDQWVSPDDPRLVKSKIAGLPVFTVTQFKEWLDRTRGGRRPELWDAGGAQEPAQDEDTSVVVPPPPGPVAAPEPKAVSEPEPISPPKDAEEALLGVVRSWRDSLLDLSGRNRLLNFKHLQTATLEIIAPSPESVIRGLERGLSFDRIDEDGERPSSRGSLLVTQKSTQAQLDRSLKRLSAASTQHFNETGLWVLYLGVGFVEWRDDPVGEFNAAPIVLIPARLDRTEDGSYDLVAVEDSEPIMNPALAVKAAEVRLSWPDPAELDTDNLSWTLSAVRRAVSPRGWKVNERVVLAVFHAHKEAMYRDLLDNEARILQHPVVRAIALGPRAQTAGAEPAALAPMEDIDVVQPPEDTPLVLDADASQRQCVATAVDGRTFVMDGPPGTGKSQTIANMIAALLHQGRSVLFVSEKAAALDVVRNRLDQVGLGSFLLALHSEKTGRKQVAQELGRTLDERVKASRTMSEEDRHRVRSLRRRLSEYAEAINETRRPLDRTLHDVIGRLAELQAVPSLPVVGGGFVPGELTGHALVDILDAADALSRAWRPVIEGPDFVWRDLRGRANPLPAVDAALERLASLERCLAKHGKLANSLGLNDLASVERLLATLRLTRNRPDVPSGWLTATDLSGTITEIDRFAGALEEVRSLETAARQIAGDSWRDIPVDLVDEIPLHQASLDRLQPTGVLLSGLDSTSAKDLVKRFSDTMAMIAAHRDSLRGIATLYGVAVPTNAQQAISLCELTLLACSADKPEAAWLNSEERERARNAATSLSAALIELRGARDRAELNFTDRVLSADNLDDAVRWLEGPFRSDTRYLARLSTMSTYTDAMVTRLPQAIDWQRAHQAFWHVAEESFPSLGDYWSGESTDFDLIDQLMAVAERISSLAPRIVDPERFAAQVARGGTPHRGVIESARVLQSGLRELPRLAAMFGVRTPATLTEVVALCDLIAFANVPDKSRASWLDATSPLPTHDQVRALESVVHRLRGAREQATSSGFTDAVLATDGLPKVAERLATQKGVFSVLSSTHRADRRYVAELTAAGSWNSGLVELLPLALEWRRAQSAFDEAADANKDWLGEFWQEERTDFHAIIRAVETARKIRELIPNPADLGALARQVTLGSTPDPAAIRTGALISAHLKTLPQVTAVCGLPVPETLGEVVAFCSVMSYADAARKPEPAWLDDSKRAKARAAASASRAATARLAAARAAASDMFTSEILSATDLEEISERFDGAHARAKAYIAQFTRTGAWSMDLLDGLGQALAWKRAAAEFRTVEQRHAGSLGSFWAGEATDFDAISRGLDQADRIDERARDVFDSDALAVQVALGGNTNETVQPLATKIAADLEEWKRSLVPAPLKGPRLGLERLDFENAIEWYGEHISALNAVIELNEAVHGTDGSGDVDEARAKLTAVRAAVSAQSAFLGEAERHTALLGGLYAQVETDLDLVGRSLNWARQVREVTGSMTSVAAEAFSLSTDDPLLAAAYQSWNEAKSEVLGLFDDAKANRLAKTFVGGADAARETLLRMRSDADGPREWRAFTGARARLGAHGLSGIVDQMISSRVSSDRLSDMIERAVLSSWVDGVLENDERLEDVRGVDQDARIKDFRKLDHLLISTSHALVIDACNTRRPKPNVGEAATIAREAQKKTRHKPVRTLLAEAGHAIRALKPCLMMSPLTVSQFLPTDYTFDVVIFDEASQVLPQDAVNCVYRGKSLIVAGDQNQLPPTSFFTGSSGDESEDYDEDTPDAFESLLDLCKASGVIPSLPLQWHYRSRHESLIAFSNREFYENTMVTFPGPVEGGQNVGVSFVKVDGVYDRGKSATNRIEAAAVAERVIHHYETRPGLSLGVVAMSERQAEAIWEAVEEARLARPRLNKYFADDRLDGFFVKNLETVQGDERDVIIISIGYGPDHEGKLAMNFGPLNRQDGWRRLNVAVTRARSRVEVVASLRSSDIDEGENVSRRHLKRYLAYAEGDTGSIGRHQGDVSDPGLFGPFEEVVASTLEEWGYDVERRLGVAGYKIDIAVRHPERRENFVIGVECDGGMYGSARATRDRDRLRGEVLKRLSWRLHRVWSIDWLRDPEGTKERLRSAITDAMTNIEQPVKVRERSPFAGPVIRTVDARNYTPGRDWAVPYKMARLPSVDLYWDDTSQVGDMIYTIAQAEAPIHWDLVRQRLRDWWSARITASVDEALQQALRLLVRRKRVRQRDDFLYLPGMNVTLARTPSAGVTRKISHIAPEERQIVLVQLAMEAPGIEEQELFTETVRFFGGGRSSWISSELLADDLRVLKTRGALDGLTIRYSSDALLRAVRNREGSRSDKPTKTSIV
ncbi:DUF4011 domain-containing protein [Microbispora bryophytorum]|uniref:DUF4011 domain-containing protein n=1 Tax=Microbispora bryophytorum TaxID=1460882 RepID=A0A8H9LDY8_9ACTN|nr:DUF4011 domain-containing protein [Microbispora bryophytorum]MBD3135740.1 DUF4011 domain-containing protein [Microbispora bryophytorum]TQS09903.1 DUF4011 domain-containing protein [Microbispora bryophytorum]GGN99223.1 hypothetical protein GCM10011574_04640 [Microbispora bryophytorum]